MSVNDFDAHQQNVTQSFLNEIYHFRLQKQRIEIRRRRAVETILAGGGVEPGRFTAQVLIRDTARQFTRQNLTALLGPDEVNRLYSRLPANTLRILDVRVSSFYAEAPFIELPGTTTGAVQIPYRIPQEEQDLF